MSLLGNLFRDKLSKKAPAAPKSPAPAPKLGLKAALKPAPKPAPKAAAPKAAASKARAPEEVETPPSPEELPPERVAAVPDLDQIREQLKEIEEIIGPSEAGGLITGVGDDYVALELPLKDVVDVLPSAFLRSGMPEPDPDARITVVIHDLFTQLATGKVVTKLDKLLTEIPDNYLAHDIQQHAEESITLPLPVVVNAISPDELQKRTAKPQRDAVMEGLPDLFGPRGAPVVAAAPPEPVEAEVEAVAPPKPAPAPVEAVVEAAEPEVAVPPAEELVMPAPAEPEMAVAPAEEVAVPVPAEPEIAVPPVEEIEAAAPAEPELAAARAEKIEAPAPPEEPAEVAPPVAEKAPRVPAAVRKGVAALKEALARPKAVPGPLVREKVPVAEEPAVARAAPVAEPEPVAATPEAPAEALAEVREEVVAPAAAPAAPPLRKKAAQPPAKPVPAAPEKVAAEAPVPAAAREKAPVAEEIPVAPAPCAEVEEGAYLFLRGVDMNKATVEELVERLDGIGPKMAEKIVQDREANGPFFYLLDLARIPGLGAKTFQQITGLPLRTGVFRYLPIVNRVLGRSPTGVPDVREVAANFKELDGFEGCVLAHADGYVMASTWAHAKDEAFGAFAPQMHKKMGWYLKQLDLGGVGSITFFMEDRPFTLVRSGDVFLIAIHEAERFSRKQIHIVQAVASELGRRLSRGSSKRTDDET